MIEKVHSELRYIFKNSQILTDLGEEAWPNGFDESTDFHGLDVPGPK